MSYTWFGFSLTPGVPAGPPDKGISVPILPWLPRSTVSAKPAPEKIVLVVEDDAEARDAMVRLLRTEGYTVVTAGDGQQALDLLHAAVPDLILLDLLLPGMDGWEFRQRQQDDPALARVPVVLISGTEGLARVATALAVAGFLEKPVDVDRLLTEVRRHAGGPRVEVLVVEDEPGVLRMLGMALRLYGFNVRLAGGGAEGVALFRQHRDSIDLVLMDVQMPEVDGPDAFVRMRAVEPRARVIFMSGNTGAYTTEELLALGAVRVLSKPFGNLAEIPQALREAVRPT
jgi:CheY-like chemotaxis protein